MRGKGARNHSLFSWMFSATSCDCLREPQVLAVGPILHHLGMPRMEEEPSGKEPSGTRHYLSCLQIILQHGDRGLIATHMGFTREIAGDSGSRLPWRRNA